MPSSASIRATRAANAPPAAGRSNTMKRNARQRGSCGSPARTSALATSNWPRPIHSSPSIGTGGQPRVNQAGTAIGSPPRVHSARPSQRPRTPSSFSLTRYAATSPCPRYAVASIGGACGAAASTMPGPARQAASTIPATTRIVCSTKSIPGSSVALRGHGVRRRASDPGVGQRRGLIRVGLPSYHPDRPGGQGCRRAQGRTKGTT